MGIQKYRADRRGDPNPDGSIPWFTDWVGGPSLAKIENCRFDEDAPNERRTVYITGDADTFFSQPGVCQWKGKRVKGFITQDEMGPVFHGYHSPDWPPPLTSETA
jgi:hypothetical protein